MGGTITQARSGGAADLLLDDLMPQADAATSATVMVDAPADMTYATALDVDFAAMPRTDPLMRWLFAIRGVPDRIARAVNRTPPSQLDDALFLRDLDTGPAEWVRLGEQPGREFLFGAIGQMWNGEIRWRPTTCEEFTGFTEPGWAKIAASITVEPHGSGRCLLTYECRTTGTDAVATERFMRYWRLVSTGVRIVLWRSAVAIRRHAEARAGA